MYDEDRSEPCKSGRLLGRLCMLDSAFQPSSTMAHKQTGSSGAVLTI